MRRPRLLPGMLAGAALAVPALLSGGSAVAATDQGWGTVAAVPGLSALNSGGDANINSMSCPASGNCAAGGFYTTASAVSQQAFVVDENGGAWGQAIEVPGTAALNPGGLAQVSSVSCSSPGNCTAGGYVSPAAGSAAFVADEVGGVWGQAIAVPGTAGLNNSQVNSVSCARGTAADCVAGGFYAGRSGVEQAFVADEVNGVWGQAIAVPGTAALATGGGASVDEVSCPVPGGCTVVGSYSVTGGSQLPFAAGQHSGAWSRAVELPGIATLNNGPLAQVGGLSCTSAGNCAAGGSYSIPGNNAFEAFVADEKSGIWAPAREMPGIAALNPGDGAGVNSVACTSSGNCAAVGYYANSSHEQLPFAINETGGVWGKAAEVPGIAALTKGVAIQPNSQVAEAVSVSCSSAGNCSAGGDYASFMKGFFVETQALVVNEAKGVWQQASRVPGANALNTAHHGKVTTVDCALAGTCALAGYYEVKPFTFEAYTDSRG